MRQRAEPPLPQGGSQTANGVFASGVGLERPLHEWGAVGVNHDDGDLAAIDTPSGIEVPDGRSARRTADLGFLGHAFEGFGGQILGVELSNTSHDGMKQLTSWSVVDVFLDRDEPTASGLQFEQGIGVVAAIAGKAVDLIENDIVNIALGADAGEHALELVPVSGLGALAPVEVLPYHLGTQLGSLAVTGVALRG